MSAVDACAPFEAFYLPTGDGQRHCIYHPARGHARGSVVYLHPFAEEMNKSRRMAALMSRKFADAGHAVLQIDLRGCGDSSGEFVDATWAAWKSDAMLAIRWLRRRVPVPLLLWGVRLGGLLALDVAHDGGEYAGIILWQPVTAGDVYLTQFLRFRVASDAMAERPTGETTDGLRNALREQQVVEVAGYELSPALFAGIEPLRIADLAPGTASVSWLDIVPDETSGVSPGSRHAAKLLQERGAEVTLHPVAGEPFWNTVEISECHSLIEKTLAMLEERYRAHT